MKKGKKKRDPHHNTGRTRAAVLQQSCFCGDRDFAPEKREKRRKKLGEESRGRGEGNRTKNGRYKMACPGRSFELKRDLQKEKAENVPNYPSLN